MKAILNKVIFLLVLSAWCLTANAQKDEDKKAITLCLQNYMSGEGDRVEKAFHLSAAMKFIMPSGEFKDMPITEYIARVKANKNTTERKSEIVYIDMEGPAAQAKIKSETDKFILCDYMNLLKINGEWKIVGKIFSRTDK